MRIEKIQMDSFMGKEDFALSFLPGLNILRGDNESGKSTVAEFIKFMLYGASSRGSDGELPERQKYLPFGGTSFGGSMEVRTNTGRYHIDRTVTAGANGFRESVAVTDLEKRTQVLKGENVGEALLGLPEEVFAKVAYLSQSGAGATGGADLSAAIENLLFSGDETVSTEKAQKLLDKLRVQLLHKNGKGGQLYDLAGEREAMEARLAKALSDNSEIIAKEGSLIDTEQRIAENKLDRDRMNKLCELYDNYVAHTRFAALDATEEELARTRTALAGAEATFNGFAPDGEYLGRLRQTAKEAEAQGETVLLAENRAKEAKQKALAAATCTAEGHIVSPDEVKRLEKRGSVGKFLKTVGIVLAVLALLGAAGVYLLRAPAYLYAIPAAALLLGILLLVLGLSIGKKLQIALASHGVSGVYELSERAHAFAERKAEIERGIADARAEESAADALLEREKARLAALKTEFRAEAERLGGAEDAPEALFAAVEQYLDRCLTLSTQIRTLTDRADRLRAETAAYDRAAVEAILAPIGDLSLFEKADIAEYRRKRDFCDNAIGALEIKKSELEKSLAALRATVEDPALLKSTLDALCKKEKAAKQKYAAAELAIRSIALASNGLRERVSPHLAEYAGRVMQVMTDGRYTEIGVDNTLSLTYMEDGSAHDAAYLSGGTRFAAYFALRLALADLLCKEESVPLLLDECFAHTDDKRVGQMLRILYALAAKDTQTILFACHDREAKLAASLGVCHVIEL